MRATAKSVAKWQRAHRTATPSDTILLKNPVEDDYEAHARANATLGLPVVEQGSANGEHLILCGAGPSLREHAAEYCVPGVQVWGCNSALTWLASHGHSVTHGFAIDQTQAMLREWGNAPDVDYFIASTVHPSLARFLLDRGRSVRCFHNYVGMKGVVEDALYASLYPRTVLAGAGLNAVTRAIDVADFMGFETITILGADCCLRQKYPKPVPLITGSPEHVRWLTDSLELHADGGSAVAAGATPMTLDAEIDGRVWVSKPDLIVSAVFLEVMRRGAGGKIRLIGDTLPNALRDKPTEYLDRLPSFLMSDGSTLSVASML